MTNGYSAHATNFEDVYQQMRDSKSDEDVQVKIVHGQERVDDSNNFTDRVKTTSHILDESEELERQQQASDFQVINFTHHESSQHVGV